MTQILTAVERSSIYQQFANAFRFPGLESELTQQYMEAFDPAVYKGARSLYESSYTTKGQEVVYEELMRFYHFFELDRSPDAELPDHLTVELEFMHFLTHLEQKALGRGDDISPIRKAQKDFLDRHMSGLVMGLSEKFQGANETILELLSDMREFITEEALHLNAPQVALDKLFM